MTKELFEAETDLVAKAAGAEIKADAAYAKAATDFAVLTAFYREFKGDLGKNKIFELVKKYGPKLATYMGLPSGAALLTGLSADEGAFKGITGLIGKVFGIGG